MGVTGPVNGRLGHKIVWLDDVIRQDPSFDFLAADVGEHLAVDLDARAHNLAALLDHFLALGRVVDDVAVLVRQVVFLEHGAHAVAPAAGWFQVGDDFWFFHNFTKLVVSMAI